MAIAGSDEESGPSHKKPVYMFNKDEAIRLQKTCEGLHGPVRCALHHTQESEFGRRLKSFVDEACRISQGKIQSVAGRPDSGLPVFPCFTLGREERADIIYAALPTGHQFTPFLKALELAGGSGPPVVGSEPDAGGSRADIQVLISEDCPRCPAAVEAAILTSNRCSSICIVDAGQFPDVARAYGIKSVPAMILDRRLVWIGSISADRLMELVKVRGTRGFEIEVVRSLIERGRIAEAADSLAHDAGREVVLDLMQDRDFSKRLSALAVVEKALDGRLDAARALVPSLVRMLSHADSRIRGDVADLLGKIGDPQAIPQLEPLIADPDPDVAEAAGEAIMELRKQCG